MIYERNSPVEQERSNERIKAKMQYKEAIDAIKLDNTCECFEKRKNDERNNHRLRCEFQKLMKTTPCVETNKILDFIVQIRLTSLESFSCEKILLE